MDKIMEDGAVDMLYGDLGQRCSDSSVNYDEESVDIYSGLDDSPKSDGSKGKDITFLSPRRLKESMDLYEELITEEQEDKEATYNELKNKFDAAQKQVKELLAQLQQIQTKNSSLHKENILLKKNICALIKTARMEIVRKDEEISKLNSSKSGWSRFPPSRVERSQELRLRSQSHTGSCVKSPVDTMKESRDGTRGLSEVSELKNGSGISSHPVHKETRTDVLPSAVPQRCTRRNLNSPLQSKDSVGTKQEFSCGQSDQTSSGKAIEKTGSEVAGIKSQSVNVTVGGQLDSTEGRKEYLQQHNNSECNPQQKDTIEKTLDKSQRSQKESVKVNCASAQSQQLAKEDPVVLRRSGRSKSPFSPMQSSTSELHSQTSKGPSKVTSDTQKQELRHQREDRRSRSGVLPVSERNSFQKSGTSPDQKTETRRSRDHHRKEERRQEDAGSSERRRTRGDGSKEYEPKRTRESDGRNRNGCSREDRRSTRSEANKDHERKNAKERDGDRQNRRSSPVKCSDHGGRTRRKDHDDEASKSKTSSKTEGQLSRSKVSGSSKDDKSSTLRVSQSDRHSVKEKFVDVGFDKGRRRVDQEKQMSQEKSGNSILPADVAKSTCLEKSGNGENGLTAHGLADVNLQTPLQSNNSCDIFAEESSPKRKLSFMETLNLTLSPVKKQSKRDEAEETVSKPPEDVPVNNSEEQSGSFELGEEFCVIDDIENNQESVEAMEDNLEPATDGDVELHGSDLGALPNQDLAIIPVSNSPKSEEKDLKAICEVSTPSEETSEEKTSVTIADNSAVSPVGISDNCTTNSHNAGDETIQGEIPLPSEVSVPVNNVPLLSVEEDENRETSSKGCQIKNEIEPKTPQTVESDATQEEVSTSMKVEQPVSEPCGNPDPCSSLELVCSSVSVGINTQNQDAFAETPTAVLDSETKTEPEELDSCLKPSEDAVPGDSSNPLMAKGTLPEEASSSEPNSTEKELQNSRPFSSQVEPQDDDSMTLTLNNIKGIPNLISPLTSPIRQIRKTTQNFGKELHVKSPCKDLSTAAFVTDKETMKMDMNKENKRPDLSVMPSVVKDQVEVLPSTAIEEELEEGEIDSKSDEESSLIIPSPTCETAKPSSKTLPCPRSPRQEQRASQMTLTVTPAHGQGQNPTAACKDSPTSNKRRFKTITIPPKASISTTAEFMNMLLFIRSELRRKYMKLHKNVTKKAFCCIVNMSSASLTDFVDGVNFQKFSCHDNDIKPRLNKIISSVMSKISNNGIVNRIFEQRADDLKQKLWNFVDGQLDFLFKELKQTLKNASGFSKSNSVERKFSNSSVKDEFNVDNGQMQTKRPLSTTEHRPIISARNPEMKQTGSTCTTRGLGSRGKNIKVIMEDGTPSSEIQSSGQPSAFIFSEKAFQESEKACTYVRCLSQSGSTQDRTDFEILTEQQTSNLTFNLVTDSQMGDIFRCLLQGSDLLEAGVAAGDNQSWPLDTPRKEGPAGDSLLGIVTPSKLITPSKVVTTWASISPYKLASPNKIQMSLNPALFDESCLLEVPNHAAPVLTTASSQQHYSILAEDLAVSMTIPSPLKSDSHLSFLHPVSGQPLSAPSSVISAHFSEDALLDGEDITEQDIHLSLDTDNSSSRSSAGQTWEERTHPPVFHFKPDLPMQAEVMERSNDHFIVRIRHTSTTAHEEPRQELKLPPAVETSAICLENKTSSSQTPLKSGSLVISQPLLTLNNGTNSQMSSKGSTSEGGTEEDPLASLLKTSESPTEQAADATSNSDAAPKNVEGVSETNSTCERISRKRRKHHSGPKAKCARTEKPQDKHEKQRHKKRSKSCKEKDEKISKKVDEPLPESPSISAKNVIRKKGEVVVTWTREEDRDILLELKMKGPSSKTFAALSAKLKKSPAQIEERFTQLMKLLKKKEKMAS